MAEPSSSLPVQRFEDYTRHHAREHELIHAAQQEAKNANEYRMERLNELRQQVEQDRNQFVTKIGSDLQHAAIEQRLRTLENASAATSSATVTWVIAVGIIFTVIQIALRFVG